MSEIANRHSGKKLRFLVSVMVFVFMLSFVGATAAQAKTITKLSGGKYYYTDTTDYGKTNVKLKNNKLYLSGKYAKYKNSRIGTLKKAKLKLTVSKNVKIYRWQEGTKKTLKKSKFAAAVKHGCALDIKIKNNKVVRIDVSAFTG